MNLLIEPWLSHFHFHKKRNKRWLQQRILYWQDKARHENVWHENFHKRGKKFLKENSLSMGLCICALHLIPNISMKITKMIFLLTQFCCVCFQSSQAHGSALNLSRFYFFIKKTSTFFINSVLFRKNVLFLQKKPYFFKKNLSWSAWILFLRTNSVWGQFHGWL